APGAAVRPGFPFTSLFRSDEDQASSVVVRADRRIRVASPHGHISYARVSPGAGRLELLEGTLEPGGESSPEPWSHPSEECVVVRSEEHTSALQSRENLVCR